MNRAHLTYGTQVCPGLKRITKEVKEKQLTSMLAEKKRAEAPVFFKKQSPVTPHVPHPENGIENLEDAGNELGAAPVPQHLNFHLSPSTATLSMKEPAPAKVAKNAKNLKSKSGAIAKTQMIQ